MNEWTLLSFLAAGVFAYGRWAHRMVDSYTDELLNWEGLRYQRYLRDKHGNEGARQIARGWSMWLSNCAGWFSLTCASIAIYKFCC